MHSFWLLLFVIMASKTFHLSRGVFRTQSIIYDGAFLRNSIMVAVSLGSKYSPTQKSDTFPNFIHSRPFLPESKLSGTNMLMLWNVISCFKLI